MHGRLEGPFVCIHAQHRQLLKQLMTLRPLHVSIHSSLTTAVSTTVPVWQTFAGGALFMPLVIQQ